MDYREAEAKKTLDDDGGGDDRISALPDGLLCHILSFLHTRQAVATAILSTRWKYLFTSLPDLDVDDSLLLRPGARINAQCFTNFVYRLLLLRKTPHINRFVLTCYTRWGNPHLNAWISSVVWRNAKELDIAVYVKEFGMVPSNDIFTCKTLVNLRLRGEYILLDPISVCLPNVKVLHLSRLEFKDDDTIRRVFSGCPLLEELVLSKCTLESVQTLDISSHSLKRLEFCGYGGDYQIVLNAPVLEYLEVSDCVAGGYLVKDLKSLDSLVAARLSVGLTKNQKGGDSLRYGSYVTNLVNVISGSIKFLRLSGQTLEAIDYSNCSLPAFCNLTLLELDVDFLHGWKLLPNLLQSAPNLEVLDFFQGFLNYTADEVELLYHLLERVPICLSQCLKEIVIREFHWEEGEIELLKYFLNCGKVLKITIVSDILVPTDIRKRFLTFPNNSKTCQIVVERLR
ncbi:hypothetical protein RHMOL_Rhmol07G0075800 [Rhododendron molle]|uniref:Uncharacterized protein n=1 Tax=Rhododendron molle TaxID=49168 RepID=A0ACC0MY05_RHOML|nr:hypothetical protein RHMOL_Rhmol07G0075800 [Rhododendron molle]